MASDNCIEENIIRKITPCLFFHLIFCLINKYKKPKKINVRTIKLKHIYNRYIYYLLPRKSEYLVLNTFYYFYINITAFFFGFSSLFLVHFSLNM